MATATKQSSIRSPRRAEGIRIAEGLGRRANLLQRITCTSRDELSPTFSIEGVRFDEPKAALRRMGEILGLYPQDNEAACRVDHILDMTDDFLKDFMSEKADNRSSAKIISTFNTMLMVIKANSVQANGAYFCVGNTLTIADIQVYAVFAITDSIPVHGFWILHRGNSISPKEALARCRNIASHVEIQQGKQYYLANGSPI